MSGPLLRPARRARRVLVAAVPVGYGTIAWLTAVHAAEGAHERGEPGFLLHWLRDGTLALPLAALAAWLALSTAGGLLARLAPAVPPEAPLARAVEAALIALLAAAALAVAGPAHAALFGAAHGPEAPASLAHIGRDALVALVAALPLAALAGVPDGPRR